MNEETWVEIETTEMRKNVKKKDEEENWRIGKEYAGSEMEEKREEEWKAVTREKERNVKKKRRVRKKKQKWKRKKKEEKAWVG